MGSFVIDALPEQAARYRETHALVVVDVFRATTVIVTALAGGHAVYPVGTLAEALNTAGRLSASLLAGEQAGIKPDGFDLDNSPAAVSELRGSAPIVLLSSAGTLLLSNCRGASAIYVACLRNMSATAEQLAGHRRVALIGAGTRGQRRPEDQLVCSRIAQLLAGAGFRPENEATRQEMLQWRDTDVDQLRSSPSADYLRGSGQEADIEFVLSHLDDISEVAVYNGQQVSLLPAAELGNVALAAEAT